MKELFYFPILMMLTSCQPGGSGGADVKNESRAQKVEVSAELPASYPKSSDAKIEAAANAKEIVVLRESYEKCVESSEGVTPSIQDCISTEYEYQDARLNEVYRQLLGQLDASKKEALREEQRQWLMHRDKECDPGEQPGQAQMLDANSCMLSMTAEKVAELEGKLNKS